MSSYYQSLGVFSPTTAIVVFTVGLLLIYVELNRPGSVIPGAVGLLLTLLACARLSMVHPRPVGELLVISAGVLLGTDLIRRSHWAVAVTATLVLVLGFHMFVEPPVGWLVCILCGVGLGATTAGLTWIARRARTNKMIRQSTENTGISGEPGNAVNKPAKL